MQNAGGLPGQTVLRARAPACRTGGPRRRSSGRASTSLPTSASTMSSRISMTDKITFGDLRHLLEECGFDRVQWDAPHVVYRHEPSGALQAFRAHRPAELADPMALASVRKTLVGFDFLEEADFEAAVRAAAAERRAKTRRG